MGKWFQDLSFTNDLESFLSATTLKECFLPPMLAASVYDILRKATWEKLRVFWGRVYTESKATLSRYGGPDVTPFIYMLVYKKKGTCIELP